MYKYITYSIALSHALPVPSLLHASTKAPTTSKAALSLQLRSKTNQARILTLQTIVDSRLRKLQASYKRDYDRRVCETRRFTPNTYVLLDSLLLLANLDSAADYLSEKEYYKPQSRTTGAFYAISVQERTVIIDKNGMSTTVFIDGVTHASRAESLLRVSYESPSTPQRQPRDKQNLTNNKYAVERVMKHIDKGRDTNCVV